MTAIPAWRLLAGFLLLFIFAASAHVQAGEAGSPAIRFDVAELPFVLHNGVTPKRHLPEIVPGGVAAFDFDNDGRIDLFFTNGAEMPGLQKNGAAFYNRLYRNTERGFEDVTYQAGLQGEGFDIGVTVGDYDNDGRLDLFVAGVYRNTLYRNVGKGKFQDVTARAGLAIPPGRKPRPWAVGGAFLDYDLDGDLDLFVSNYVVWDPATEPRCIRREIADYCHPDNYEGLPNALYRNNGDGTFSDVSEAAGLNQFIGKGMGATVSDYDDDGYPDIFISNDKVFNFLFRNRGDGTFVELSFESGVAAAQHGRPVSGMGSDFGDLDNDGKPDLVFTALPDETFPVFRNRGDGSFEDITFASGVSVLSRKMGGWSMALVDFDNDGWRDLFVARSEALSPEGRSGVAIKQPNSVIRNQGGARFEDLTDASGLGKRKPQLYRGSAVADLDGDGRQDVAVSAIGAAAEILMNRSVAAGHWLGVALKGTASNRDGLGAKITLSVGNRKLFAERKFSAGYASASAGPTHFGLGAATEVARVEIRWPSGITQVLENVKADQVIAVVEPNAAKVPER